MIDRRGVEALSVVAGGVRRELTGRDEWIIGRGRDADIQVNGDVVGRRHVALRREPTGWVLHDLASMNGLWWAGRRIGRLDLRPGEVTVHLGGPDGVPVTIILTPITAPPPPRTTPPPPHRSEQQTVAAAGPPHQGPPNPWPPHQGPPQQWSPQQWSPQQGPPQQWSPQRPPVTPDPGTRPIAAHPLRPGALHLGRAQSNDIVLDDLLVSRRHARLEVGAPGAPLRVVDLGSANGTFINGHRMQEAMLAPGGVVSIGSHLLRYDLAPTGPLLVEFDERQGVGFGAAHLSVTVNGNRQLLHDVSFSLPPRTLLAVVGPSGAGKSTLLHALTGLKPATSGTVRYAGRDLYAEYDDLSRRIGFVPQQDILHQALTVRQALGYGARLRFPAETTAAERMGRIQEVATSLRLTDQLGTRVNRLSGGERKRASTAMELLTKPSLLFLDEPTSGLDTDLDREVMRLLRQLADEGRTVVVVTHNLDYLDTCDLVLVLARGGHTAYLGPPAGAFAAFGVSSWADLFSMLKTRPPQAWGAAFAARPDRDPRSHPPALDGAQHASTRLPPIRQQSVVSQWAALTRRYLAVIGADRTLLSILLLLPILLAGIARVVPGSKGLARESGNLDARQLLLVLVVGGCLAGAAGAVRELVKERAIYRRERAVGLSRGAYLASKIFVTTGIAAVQGVLLTVLSLLGRPGPTEPLVLPTGTAEVAVVIAAVTAVSALVGLLVSAAVSDENQAMPLLVLTSMAQLVLCGGLVPVTGRAVLDQISWLLPARWGLAATASTVDLRFLSTTNPPSPVTAPLDDRWVHDAVTWWTNVGLLTSLGVLAVIVTWGLLRRLDPLR